MSRIAETFDKRAALIKGTLAKFDGVVPTKVEANSGLLSAEAIRENILLDFKEAVMQADSLRSGSKERRSIDFSLKNIVSEKFGFGTVDGFYQSLGINPSFHTLENLSSMSDFNEGYRWLQPEVIREAVRLGLRKNPIYPDLIAAEEVVDQKKVTLPHINMSDATPEILNEAENIPVGTVSFGEKDVKLHKIGTGLKISDEVQKYVSLNILSLYLQDAGVKLGQGLDTMAIDVLINGDNGSNPSPAPVVGVAGIGTMAYYDLLRNWLRLGRLGRLPSGMISAESIALDILQLSEFKGANYNNKKQNINIKTPIPQSQDYLVHGAMPSGMIGLIDNTSALLKLNASALQVESERIASRQLNGTYMTLTTGFAKLFQDAFILIDKSQAFTTFPTIMDVASAENIVIN